MINPAINIIKAAASDLNSMREILNIKELGWGCPDNYFKRLISSKEGIFLVAKHKSKIIGIIYGEFNEKEDWAELTGLAVLENYRNKGIGSRLIKEFEKIICSKNISAVEVFANMNTLAKHIHKLEYETGDSYITCRKKLK